MDAMPAKGCSIADSSQPASVAARLQSLLTAWRAIQGRDTPHDTALTPETHDYD